MRAPIRTSVRTNRTDDARYGGLDDLKWALQPTGHPTKAPPYIDVFQSFTSSFIQLFQRAER